MAQNPRPSPSPSPNPMEVKTDVGVVFADRTSTRPLGHEVIIVRHENDEYFPHEDDVSRHYFRAREHGFLVISILHVTAYISVRLFATVDRPREVVVIKRFWKYLNWEKSFNPGAPAEFLFSTLRTPATVRHLVLGEQLLPLAYMHAAAVKSFGASDLDASIWYKYYNGKELADLIYHFNKYQRKVPEMFIWHFIADYGRALAYLHNGTYRSRLYNVTTYGHLGITPQYPIPAPVARDWKPIAHHDSHQSNIFLHYPSQEEKKLDPRLARYTDEFPQCIRADFGQVFEQDDKRGKTEEWPGKKWRVPIGEFRCFSEDKHAPPEVMTWHDKAFFGESLKALILASRMNPWKVPKAFQVPLAAMRASPSDKSLEEECKIRNIPQVSAFEMRQAVRGYSDDLIKVISRFEPIMHLVMEQDDSEKKSKNMWVPRSRNYKAAYGFHAEFRACIDRAEDGQAPWDPDDGNWPLNDWCWGTLIALADVKMDQYQKGILNWDHLDSVIEPHHPRNPSAAPLNMKAEAKKYVGELMLEETMPAPWTGESVPVPIALSRARKVLLLVWEKDKKGELVHVPGITRTFPTGHRDVKYMTYDGMAREGEPGGERRFNHWVPTFQDPDVSGYMDNFSPIGSETDRPPGDEKDPYWEEVDYTIEPSHDETDLGPSGAQERTYATTTDGLIVDPSRPPPTVATWKPWQGLQVGDDEDTAVTEGLQTGLTTPGGTPFSSKAWNQLTTEILRGEKVIDVSELRSIQGAIAQGKIQLRLKDFESIEFGREIIDALRNARPRPTDGENNNNNDDNDNKDGKDGTGRQRTPSFTSSTSDLLHPFSPSSSIQRHSDTYHNPGIPISSPSVPKTPEVSPIPQAIFFLFPVLPFLV